MDLIYIDDVDVLTTYGVFLIQEKGVFSPLVSKNSFKYDWKDEHGLQLHHEDSLMNERKFSLKLGIRATTAATWKTKSQAFFDLFVASGFRQLRIGSYKKVFMVVVNGSKPMNRLTHWNSSLNVGIFTINFLEPEPVNRQYLISTTGTNVSCTGSGDQVFTVYWGDGDKDTFTASASAGHTYSGTGFRAVICGRLDKIATLTVTNSTEQTW